MLATCPTTFGSVDRLFSHESVVRIEPTISDVKGACNDDCATEVPKLFLLVKMKQSDCFHRGVKQFLN
jgi:hypothetical protein